MTNQSQKTWVIKKLKDNKFVSRNDCLSNFVSRLSAIMLELKHEGWKFKTRWVKINGGKDYQYYIDEIPMKKVIKTEIIETPEGRKARVIELMVPV